MTGIAKHSKIEYMTSTHNDLPDILGIYLVFLFMNEDFRNEHIRCA